MTKKIPFLILFAAACGGNALTPPLPLAVPATGDLGAGDLGASDLGRGDLGRGDLGRGDLGAADLAAVDLTAVDLTAVDLTAADLTPGPVDPTCALPEGPVHNWSGHDEMAALLAGRWLLCKRGLPGFGPSDEAGLEIAGDQWFILVRDAAGTLVRKNGFDYMGSVEILAPGYYQVNFVNSFVRFITTPAFEDSPRRMDLYNGNSPSPDPHQIYVPLP